MCKRSRGGRTRPRGTNLDNPQDTSNFFVTCGTRRDEDSRGLIVQNAGPRAGQVCHQCKSELGGRGCSHTTTSRRGSRRCPRHYLSTNCCRAAPLSANNINNLRPTLGVVLGDGIYIYIRVGGNRPAYRTEGPPRRRYTYILCRMAASQTGSACCGRAHSVCQYRSTDSEKIARPVDIYNM